MKRAHNVRIVFGVSTEKRKKACGGGARRGKCVRVKQHNDP